MAMGPFTNGFSTPLWGWDSCARALERLAQESERRMNSMSVMDERPYAAIVIRLQHVHF